jgi:hypothetical protein
MKRLALLWALLLWAIPAMAQDPAPPAAPPVIEHPQAIAAKPVDPRLVLPMVRAYEAQIALLTAALHAAQEDQAQREKDFAEWFKGWFGTP